jgi:hypothetical protein
LVLLADYRLELIAIPKVGHKKRVNERIANRLKSKPDLLIADVEAFGKHGLRKHGIVLINLISLAVEGAVPRYIT